MLRYVLATIALCVGLYSECQAAEFTWFTNVHGREGWIEFAAGPQNFQNRIHVFPRVGGPGAPGAAPRVEGRSDGVVVTLEIDSNAPPDAGGFTRDVLSRVVSNPARVSQDYQVDVPRPRSLRIAVTLDGAERASRQISDRIPGTHTVQVKVPVTGEERDAMLRGAFQVETSFDLPTANFSSISVNVKESLINHYKISALKSVVKSARTSGGKFLFFDWRQRSARTIVQESINEQRSTSASRQTSVLTIDPDDAMLARVEALLGIPSLSKEEFVARHLAAAAEAEKVGDIQLADLHKEYALKADDPTPRVQTELLEKAFAAMASKEPSLGAFLANGIQFSESTGSSVSRYQGFGQTDSSYFGSTGYAEMRLTTAQVRYVINIGPFAAADDDIRGFFGTARPNEEGATTGLLRAVESSNIAMVRAALRFGANYNAVYGMKRETPLTIASQRCNTEIVRALLQAGANPFLRDSNGRTAKRQAELAGCQTIASLIEGFASAKTLNFNLGEGPGVKLVKVDIEESGTVYEGGRTGPTFETVRGEKLFRAIITADVQVNETERQARAAYYDHFHFLRSRFVNGQLVNLYRIRDVVRFPITVVNGDTVDFEIHFDTSVPGLTFANKEGGPYAIDRIARFSDNQHFGFAPRAFDGANSTSPRTVCLEQRPDPQHPMIMECARWGSQ